MQPLNVNVNKPNHKSRIFSVIITSTCHSYIITYLLSHNIIVVRCALDNNGFIVQL